MPITWGRFVTWQNSTGALSGPRSQFLGANPRNSLPAWCPVRLRSVKPRGGQRLRPGLRRTIITTMGIAVVCLLVAARTGGQTESARKPLMAEQYFKNVQVLRGISVKEFMDTMGFFAASLGENCTFCHVEESGGDWSKYAHDNANKQTAPKMILMMTAINKSYFGGRRMLTCYSPHRGGQTPRGTPNLAEQYSAPVLEETDQITRQPTNAPSAAHNLCQYVQAAR